MSSECQCCRLAYEMPDITKKTYSMGCNFCAARYLRDGGKDDIAKWQCYGVDVREVAALRSQGEFIEPELKKGKRK